MDGKKDHMKVVLVDDSEIDLFLYNKMLSTFVDESNISSFVNSSSALHYIQSFIPTNTTILFLDINMPIISGFDILDMLAILPEKILQKYKVYIVTSSTNRNDHARISEYQFVSGLFIKPLTTEKVKSLFE
jgi:CheY-like chemotaxis protein